MAFLNRNSVVEKFVRTFHLSVPERDFVGTISTVEICNQIRTILLREKRYPAHLSPDKDFDGTVIFEQDGRYVVLSKKEIGLLRFGETDRRMFDDSDSAILYGVQKIFGHFHDGIKISW